MLYRVNDKPILEEHPEISQIPELAGLADKVLKWIFMVYDWEGPYRKLPLAKRREIAANKMLYTPNRKTNFDKYVTKLLKGEVAEVNHGIAAFNEQQYDEDRETLEDLKEGIRDIRKLMRTEAKTFKDGKDKADLAKKLREMAEEKKVIEEIFDIRDGISSDEDYFEKSASVLDEYMENED